VLLADGMARRLTRHEPMWDVGNAKGIEARQGPIEIFNFLEGRRCAGTVATPHWSSPPDHLMRDLENRPPRQSP
jgi:hypothetical protein